MNLFTDLNKVKSSFLASKEAPTGFRTCTPCCPFDTRNLPHPQCPSMAAIRPGEAVNTEACCLSKLRVNCRIRCEKKKRKWAKEKRYDSTQSTPSVKRSLSSSSAISEQRKRSRLRSRTNTNNHQYESIDHRSTSSSSASSASTRSIADEDEILTDTSSSEESLKASAQRLTKNSNYRSDRKALAVVDMRQYPPRNPSSIRVNQTIEHLKTSIDHLTHLITHSASKSSLVVRSTSWFDRFRWFFAFFKSSSSSPPSDHFLHDECEQILEQHHLSKAKLISIYHLFDRNETIFLTWLRTIMPQYLLPLLLNYVKHFPPMSISQQ